MGDNTFFQNLGPICLITAIYRKLIVILLGRGHIIASTAQANSTTNGSCSKEYRKTKVRGNKHTPGMAVFSKQCFGAHTDFLRAFFR